MIDCIRSRLVHLLAVALAVATIAGLSACGDNRDCTGDACDNPPVEICGQPGDEDEDGAADCEDTDCAEDPACVDLCGNGVQNIGEGCDDQNDVDTDDCTSVCQRARCGDGFVHAGVEQCDDTNTSNADLCTNACQTARCGDGIRRTEGPNPEECDDGNQNNTDGCSNTCTVMRCGDGILNPGEACDDGNQNNDDDCTTACAPPTCGDGFVQASRNEQCDDMNMEDGDACLNTCQIARCGDGHLRTDAMAEACDDADNDDGDGCSATCTVENGWMCSMVPSQCETVCGDGIITGLETCDQGGMNTANGDGCDENCTVELNWTCMGVPSVCDTCGNGVIGPGEQCDDGNTGSLDGCSSACRTELSELEPNEDGATVTGGSNITGNDFDAAGGIAVMNAHAQGALLASAGSTVRLAKIDPAGDEDVYEITNDTATAIEVKVDTWNRAAMYGLGVPCGTSIDTGLQVRLADGTVLLSNDDRNFSADRCSGVSGVLPAGATVYAQVVEYADDDPIDMPGYGVQVQFIPIVCGDNRRVAPVEECDDGNLVADDGCSATCTVDIACPAGQMPVVVNNTNVTAIPDNDQVTGVSSTVMVPTTGAVMSLRVYIASLTHTNDTDLDIYLDAPSGQRRDLSTDNGSTSDNYIGTLITDTGPTAITSGSAPFSLGPYRPEQSLTTTAGTDFTRINAAGTWTLRVFDDLANNTGSLNAWRLLACVDPTGYCGDGMVNLGDECDDGNTVNNDACTNLCQVTDGCGDGNLDAGETCDDDNLVSGDGCSATCAPEASCAAGLTPVVVSNSTATAIPDNDQVTGASSGVMIPTTGALVSARVYIASLTHTNDTDLDIYLESPRGTRRDLSTDNGSTGDNYYNTSIDDTATTAITSGTAPFNGRFKPEFSITTTAGADFTRQNAAGTWTLRVFDDLANNTGTLQSWSLVACVDPAATYCGDAMVNGPEECDDGNGNNADACNNLCTLVDGCGDGNLDAGEACDDDNIVSGDGCSATCVPEITCAAGQTAVVVSNSTATAIPDNDQVTGASSSVMVATTGAIVSAKVYIGSLTHTNDTDLDIYVESPGGTRRELSTDNGSSGDNYYNTMFDETATSTITSGSAPFNGRYKPEFSLATTPGTDFARLNASGTWTLRVFDDLANNTGTLQTWTLLACVDPAATYCGDGVANAASEECDDGNLNNGDTCNNMCQIADGCGDGNIDMGEVCDDNNFASGDGCSATCQLELTCGAGEMQVILTNSNQTEILPDGNNAGMLSTINVGTAGLVRKVVLIVSVTHTTNNQVDLYLISPFGGQRDISTDQTGSNYWSTIFSDSATTAITAGVSPYNGVYRPETTLDYFNNQSSAGDWLLRVADDTGSTPAVTGTLDSWTLALCVDPAMSKLCGNGIVEANETCDDGNTMAGDGCSDACAIELGCAAGETAVLVTSADEKLLIPDSNATGITSNIAVNQAGTVTKAVVGIGNIGHTFDGDIDMSLIAPNATTLDLSSDNGSGGDDYLGTVLADAATALITGATAPMRGYYKPEAALAGVNGQAATGNWGLKIVDDASGDSGPLRHWTIGLCVAP